MDEYLGMRFQKCWAEPNPGTMAFVRCLTSDVVKMLAEDDAFDVRDWRVYRVADKSEARTITADQAVERREAKGDATLLLVDTDLAGAGMDGIYSASREVDETSLFKEARRLAAAEVTRQLSRPHRLYASGPSKKPKDSAVSTAFRLGRRSISCVALQRTNSTPARIFICSVCGRSRNPRTWIARKRWTYRAFS